MRTIWIGVLVACACVGLGSTQAAAKTTWLCRPGLAHDVCAVGLKATTFTPAGQQLGTVNPKRPRRRIDCFYVYPTVSDQKTGNANLHVDPEERSIALYQAARYSQYCNVYAPMYRQLTLVGIGLGTPTTKPDAALAFSDVRRAFTEYLHRYSHGRGFVLIGHSQGTGMLTELVQKVIDRKPAVRRRLVSAILLGGHITVRRGSDVGGSFHHVPACRSRTQTGCVVAFSTFDQTPPPNSIFGRNQGALGTAPPNQHVLCTNPAAPGGGSGLLTPIFPSEPFAPGTTIATAGSLVGYPPAVTATTPFIEFPRSFRASCSSEGGAYVLRVTPLGGAPTPKPIPDATWGLHLLDANIALGNLVDLVRSEAAAYERRR